MIDLEKIQTPDDVEQYAHEHDCIELAMSCRIFRAGGISWHRALIIAVITLAENKKHYMDELTKRLAFRPAPVIIVTSEEEQWVAVWVSEDDDCYPMGLNEDAWIWAEFVCHSCPDTPRVTYKGALAKDIDWRLVNRYIHLFPSDAK